MVRELGDGGSSSVMLSEHRSTGEHYALKLMHEQYQNERGIKFIEREISLQARCRNCPNIVRFKENFMCENKYCIVMEYMEGGDL